MSDATPQLGHEVRELCRRLGFALAGLCEAKQSGHEEEFRAWLARGSHGEMDWLTRSVDERLDPAKLLPGARSIIMVADLYADGPHSAPEAEANVHEHSDPSAPSRGLLARYAQGDDYHDVIKRRLHNLCDALRQRFPGESFRACVDTAPLLEREHAARAGLGWVGKHTLLIHPELGSWTLLGGVVTTLVIDPPDDQRRSTDHCGSCTRCIDACPTSAITPYTVDATRCISYLTIEHRGPIDPALHGPMGSWIFGCDICQDVCPHNRERGPSRESSRPAPNAAYAPRHTSFDLLDVLGWSEDDRRRMLTKSAMKRAKLEMWKRNALIAAGNALRARGNPALLARVESIASDDAEGELVRTTAKQVLASLAR